MNALRMLTLPLAMLLLIAPFAAPVHAASDRDPCEQAPRLLVWTECNMGPGSGLDADMLDGLDSSRFVRLEPAPDVYKVHLTGTYALALDRSASEANGPLLDLLSGGEHLWRLQAGMDQPGDLGLMTGGSARVATFLPNGNVGFGTTAPEARLDVAGSLRVADGTQADGRVLTSDANGVAHWAPSADRVLHVRRDAGSTLECDEAYHAVPGLALSFSTGSPARLDITSSVNAIIEGQQTDTVLRVDGVQEDSSFDVFILTGRASFHSGTVVDVGAGDHTVELMHRCWSGGSVVVDNVGTLTVRTSAL